MPHSEAQAWWADVQHVRETIERRRAGLADASAPREAGTETRFARRAAAAEAAGRRAAAGPAGRGAAGGALDGTRVPPPRGGARGARPGRGAPGAGGGSR